MSNDAYDLDHIALAAADTSDLLRFLTGVCGGTILWGGASIGFRPMQVHIGNAESGMKIELLEPWETERNDFLQRFVQRHIHGPHHMTFKVPDIRAAIERFRESGFSPVNIDLRDPYWMECFLMPREAHGTVVQLAQTNETSAFVDRKELLAHLAVHGPNGNPRWWVDADPPVDEPLVLQNVVMATPSVSAALGFFAGLLGGAVVGESADRIDLQWPGGAALSLEQNTDVAPGVDRLEIEGLTEAQTVLGTRFVPAD